MNSIAVNSTTNNEQYTCNSDIISIARITEEDVQKVIQKLKHRSAIGTDNIRR